MITDLANEAKFVKRGEILVAHYTSPAWTPLFSLVNGVVLEEGGMLSHGAVVAREFCIAALSQIRNATKILKSGDKIRMNGDTGVLEVLELA